MSQEPSYGQTRPPGGPRAELMPATQPVVDLALSNRATWQVWLWLVWLLPAVLIVIKLSMPGGLEKLFLFMLSPIVVVLAGLLGWLPRFVLKKRGFRYSPTSASAVFVVHWWAFSMCVLGIGSADHKGPIPSPLDRALPFLGGEIGGEVVRFSMGVTGISYVALVVLAVWTPVGTQRRHASWTVWAAVAVTPLILIGLGTLV